MNQAIALDLAISAWERILNDPSFTGASPRTKAALLNEPGGVFLLRYWRNGWLEGLEFSLSLFQQAVSLTPQSSSDLPASLNNLGTGFRERDNRIGNG